MRVLLMGKDGQVGQELSRFFPAEYDVVAAARARCDLSHPQSVRALIRQVEPEVIVNAAAYTAVDRAESEQELCYAVNAAAPGVIAQEAERLGALLVHYSTDYVFDGDKPEPYKETDKTAPLGVYGASKAEGECAVAGNAGRFLILRTSWIYASHGKNFLRTMLRLGAERPELRVVDDQIGSPTSAAAIAGATIRLIERYGRGPVPSGIYHMTAAGSTSWCGFAREIVKGLRPEPRVIPISSAEYPTPAKRPRNSVLSNEKFERAFGFHLGPWREQCEEVMAAVAIGERLRA